MNTSKILRVVEINGNNTVLEDITIISTEHFASLCSIPQVGKSYFITINDLNVVVDIQEVTE